jgi:hypothetical protein
MEHDTSHKPSTRKKLPGISRAPEERELVAGGKERSGPLWRTESDAAPGK